ncbi:MAG: UDP-N-acetylglucosamine--N-acetylmuramyl-(pentapeptide) pyrophosphoryl-undecaprenol N-acetylglucosamine transferase [Candidatus Kerfeldbacteria bacterium]|nr:UDP-N-acetylglucosamine--N-acetylmuramyl-(pentapeptide) pyrophosphoryl-undecaprenol N-acetylglucosamine transferase [Candidatus Kerfeldbacteria bacterium]
MARIVCAGGGTLGSVTPLLALVPELQKRNAEVTWIGTYRGPERQVVEGAGVRFFPIVAPKFRRYISWRHLLLPCEFLFSLIQSFCLLAYLRPHLVLSAGGFVAVPVIWLGKVFGAKVIVHQQDVEVGLANRLSFFVADIITTALPLHERVINRHNVVWTGNPVRDLAPTTHIFSHTGPTILIFGGGTGAAGINALVSKELCVNATVIHITGAGKSSASFEDPHYITFPFLREEMKEALARADVVVCRAGLGTLSELAALKKAAIIIPLPGTHQEKNAQLLTEHHAAVVRTQSDLTPTALANQVAELLANPLARHTLGSSLHALFPQNTVGRYGEIIDATLR